MSAPASLCRGTCKRCPRPRVSGKKLANVVGLMRIDITSNGTKVRYWNHTFDRFPRNEHWTKMGGKRHLSMSVQDIQFAFQPSFLPRSAVPVKFDRSRVLSADRRASLQAAVPSRYSLSDTLVVTVRPVIIPDGAITMALVYAGTDKLVGLYSSVSQQQFIGGAGKALEKNHEQNGITR